MPQEAFFFYNQCCHFNAL